MQHYFFYASAVVLGEEYCEYETFSPSCARDEVILMTEALYGRMKTGKCIRLPDPYADLGCSTNVQSTLSQQCSGRQSCSFRVSYLVTDHQGSCPPSTIRSYLDVTYTCLRGNKKKNNKCKICLSRNIVLYSLITKKFTGKKIVVLKF